ncbi:MAG: hypothetical protein Q9182_000975 [Xanthomendoza sp. 2 TL-2023]
MEDAATSPEKIEETQGLRNNLSSDASVLEDRLYVDSAMISAQSHSIMVFTTVTIFFLPLTFLTSYLSIKKNDPSESFLYFTFVTAVVSVPTFFFFGSLSSGANLWRTETKVLSELADIQKWDDIPPESRKAEYRYNPIPAEIVPPIGPNHMMHLIEHPDHAEADGTCLDKVPKKLREKLRTCPNQGIGLGWGICFVEGLNWLTIWILGSAGLLLSMGFGILWRAPKFASPRLLRLPQSLPVRDPYANGTVLMTDLLYTLHSFPTKLYTHLIPSLEKNLITTTDLLTLDPLEIAKRAQLPLLDVRRLTNHVLASLQSQLGVVDGKEALRKYEVSPVLQDTPPLKQSGSSLASKWSAISTLDPVLDSALGGGIPTTYITEITGESGTGKTQFLLSLLLTTQLPPPQGLSRPAVYISTEHPLPTTRLTQLLHAHPHFSSLPPLKRPSLTRIFSIQTPDLESQDHILTYQLPVLLARHKIALILIDSIAANYRAERSSAATAGAALGLRSTQLIQLGHQLRTLAREHDCAVVVSNQVADRFTPIPTLSPPPQRPRDSSPSSTHSLSSPASTQPAMQSLDTLIMPPPAPSIPAPYPPLTLDHQQNFFTGWSSGPPTKQSHQNLKTPSLGLVWTNQIACRIALLKERAQGEGAVESTVAHSWRRSMKVVFASWTAATGGTEFEIWAGGVRGVVVVEK